MVCHHGVPVRLYVVLVRSVVGAFAAVLVQEDLEGMPGEQQECARVQNKLAGIWEDMCKEVGAYPMCTCPGFTLPDTNPGVMI